MKTQLIQSLALMATLGFAVDNVQATTYTFDDNWVNWNNEEIYNTTSLGDENGTPQLDYMEVTVDDTTGYLQQIDFILHDSSNRQAFDSLFINSYNITTNDSKWEDWDYFVHDGGGNHSGDSNGTVPGNGLYSVKKTGYAYTLATTNRIDNPNGIAESSLNLMDSTFGASQSGWTISYDFTSLEIDVSDGFFMAYAPWCANDVMGGGTAPVPEPATMLLFGTGLAGLATVGRKKMKRT